MTSRMYKTAVLLVVAAVLIAVVAWRLQTRRAQAGEVCPTVVSAPEPSTARPGPAAAQPGPKAAPSQAFPAGIDLGMGKCIPCKQMKPILDELKQEYAGRCRVEIIDVGERPDQSDKYRIMLIPTQIFFDAKGTEVYRHEGFMPKADIVAKLKEMGVK